MSRAGLACPVGADGGLLHNLLLHNPVVNAPAAGTASPNADQRASAEAVLHNHTPLTGAVLRHSMWSQLTRAVLHNRTPHASSRVAALDTPATRASAVEATPCMPCRPAALDTPAPATHHTTTEDSGIR